MRENTTPDRVEKAAIINIVKKMPRGRSRFGFTNSSEVDTKQSNPFFYRFKLLKIRFFMCFFYVIFSTNEKIETFRGA